MVSLTFSGLFLTTRRGIPDLTSLPSSTNISLSYFICSTLLQLIIFLYFVSYFIVAVNRVALKVKNKGFRDLALKRETSSNSKKDVERQGANQHQKEVKKNQSIYQFDDLDEQPEEPQTEQKDDFQSYHDQNQESFINLDNKLIHFQPFLASFIVCNNILAIDILSSSLLILTLSSFVLFNLKRKFKTKKMFSSLYMLLSILGFFSYFFNKPNPL